MIMELPSPPAAGWHDGLALGHAPIDRVHREFAGLLASLADAADAQLPAELARVQAHCREHFGQEDAWMEQTAFPARECHAAEHAAVLASIDGVAARLALGEVEPARRLAAALADWFPPHTQHLDSALAHWLCQRRLGGRPVVLRGRLGERLAGAATPQEPTTC